MSQTISIFSFLFFLVFTQALKADLTNNNQILKKECGNTWPHRWTSVRKISVRKVYSPPNTLMGHHEGYYVNEIGHYCEFSGFTHQEIKGLIFDGICQGK